MQDTLDWNTTNIMINQVYPHVFHVANTVLLLAKQFICRARCLKTKLSVTDFTAEVKKIYCFKYYYAKAKKKTIKHKNGTICTKVVRLHQQLI